jgi:hypothetical protein
MEVRRKMIDENGEWIFECSNCELWLPKGKFRGCKTYIDAYGNCLICSSCRSSKAQNKRVEDYEEEVKTWLNSMGYDTESDVPVWIQFHKKHGLPYKENQ